MTELIITSLLLGLMGAGHCLGMCGGFAAALAYAIPEKTQAFKTQLLITYNLGRILSYGVMGAFVAASQSAFFSSGYPIARTIAGLLLIATALYLANIWQGIRVIERVGQKLWRYLQPLSQRLLPVKTIPQAFALGMLWGWLPCGLVYSVLVLAATQNSVFAGAVTMAAFGFGTLPAVLAGGLAAKGLQTWLRQRWFTRLLALSFGLFGIWTIAVAWYHAGHHGHHNAQHHNHQQHATPSQTQGQSDSPPETPSGMGAEIQTTDEEMPDHSHHHHH